MQYLLEMLTRPCTRPHFKALIPGNKSGLFHLAQNLLLHHLCCLLALAASPLVLLAPGPPPAQALPPLFVPR